MVIRILGLFGIFLGLTLVGVNDYQVKSISTAENVSMMSNFPWHIFFVLLGLFFVFYGAIWVMEGYGNKSIHDSSAAIDPKLVGLRGWLILLAVVLVIQMTLNFFALIGVYELVVTNTGWQAFKDSSSFSELLLAGMVLLHAITWGMYIYLMYLFFSKKTLFPKVFILLTFFALSVAAIDGYVLNYISSFSNGSLKPNFETYSRSAIIGSILWTLYVIYSKRVNATFVN